MKKFLLIALFVLIPACAHAAEKESAFDRILRTGVIRCGYAVWYPELIKDPNTGALSGYDYDVMNAVGDILALKIEWTEEYDWSAAQDGLTAGRYDVACNGFWGPPARTKVVLQSIPFVHHPVFVVVSDKMETPQTGYAWLNDSKYKVAVFRNTALDLLARMSFPKAQAVDAATLSNDGNMLADIADGKVDYGFANYSPVARYLEQNKGGVKILQPQVGVGNGSFLMPGGDYRLKHMIDSGLQFLIDSGGTEPIMEKYMGKDAKAWLPPARSYEAAQ